ncbi:MAG TPA: hypothetical protein GXX55_07480 [Firmicutes bacterium]|nr:hypothetical protein [Bacillota bacterium]
MMRWETRRGDAGGTVLLLDSTDGSLRGLGESSTGRWYVNGQAGEPADREPGRPYPWFELVALDPAHRRYSLPSGPVTGVRKDGGTLWLDFAPVAGIRAAVEIAPGPGGGQAGAGEPGKPPELAGGAGDPPAGAGPGQPGWPPGSSLWRLHLANQSQDLTVVEILFPCLRGIDPEPIVLPDVLIFPHHAGERTADPRTAYRSARYLSFGRAATIRENEDFYVREITYCGLASMMWLDYYDGLGGLYLASYDPGFLLTGLRVEVKRAATDRGTESPAGAGTRSGSRWRLGFGLRKYVPISPGESWESPPAVVWAHPGDWHAAARQYREWFDRHGRPSYDPIPEDMRAEAVVTPWYDLRRAEGVLHRFGELPSIYDEVAASRWGSRHLFLAGWNRGGFDSQYPEYHPDLELGSPVDLRRVVEHVEGQGGMVTFYINSRLFDRSSFYHSTLGKEWAIRSETGERYTETYGPVTFDVCCPAHAGWQKHLADFAEWMVAAYGARGIYLDQLGSATPFPCYAENHSHRGDPPFHREAANHAQQPGEIIHQTAHQAARQIVHHGLYNLGYIGLLDEVTRRLKKYRADAFLMIENCGDLYSSRVWGSLAWNGTLYDEFFRLFKYTFPDCTLVQMIQPRAALAPEQKLGQFRADLDRAWLLGSVFWIHPPRVERPAGMRAEEAEMVVAEAKALLRLRQEVAPLLARARFVDTDDLVWEEAGEERPEGAPDAGEFASHWVLTREGAGGSRNPGETGEHLVLLVRGGAGCRDLGRLMPALRLRVGDRRSGGERWRWRCYSASPGEDEIKVEEGVAVTAGDGTLPLGQPAGCWQAWHWVKEGA